MNAEPLRELAIELGDVLLTLVGWKVSLVLLITGLLAWSVRRRASAVAGCWALGIIALIAVPFAEPPVPMLELELFAFPIVLLAGERGPGWGPSAGMIMVAVWGLGVLIGLARLARGTWLAGGLSRRARPVDDAVWAASLSTARGLARVDRPVRLALSAEMESAAVFGVWRPVILLPASASVWPARERVTVLAHELAHVRRADWAVALVAAFIRVLLWPNPLIHWAVRRLRFHQDLAADDVAMRAEASRPAYARRLLGHAKRQRQPAVAAAALPFISRPGIRARLAAVLDDRRDRRPITVRLVAVQAAVFVVLLALAGRVSPWYCPDPPAPDTAAVAAPVTASTAAPSV